MQGEMRLNMPADLRAKAEAELLAMLAAEEEEKVRLVPFLAHHINIPILNPCSSQARR
jgi:hypothetical protein